MTKVKKVKKPEKTINNKKLLSFDAEEEQE
jgi:hypothetical protein